MKDCDHDFSNGATMTPYGYAVVARYCDKCETWITTEAGRRAGYRDVAEIRPTEQEHTP